ncbi:MAG: rhomboid family intramembrane serine protease [Desulfobacterales bacterium]
MIPLRDDIPARSTPVVNHLLIAVNVAVFLLQAAQGPHADRFVYVYGLVPARYFVPQIAEYFSTGQQLFALLSFMFLHGGLWHLIGNMWSLYIFGDNVEDRLGPVRYAAFYLLSGLLSGVAHMLIYRLSNIPTIGASGAIAGVMGAYFLLYPRSRVLTLVPILFIPLFFHIPAAFYLGLWFFLQFWQAAGSSGAGGIAWWAHIGGFIAGMGLIHGFERLPAAGISDPQRRTTERLQFISPSAETGDPHIHGTVAVSPHEARHGARKLVGIRQGFYEKILRVQIPPGVRDGMVLRLKGLGRRTAHGAAGDLLLTIVVAEQPAH